MEARMAGGLSLRRPATAKPESLASAMTPQQSDLRSQVQAALDADEPAAAVSACEARLREAPDDTSAHRHLGQVHAALGEREPALQAAKRAVDLAPDDARAWSDLGRIHAMFGEGADAIAAFQRAVGIDERYADGWHNLGTALKRKGDSVRAFDSLKRALKIDPTRTVSYLALGELLVRAGQIDDAAACFERAVRYDPGLYRAATRLGHHLSTRGEVDNAAETFRLAVSRDPQDPDAWFGLGSTLEDLGERDAAAACYRNALGRNPGHGLALSRLLSLSGDTLEPEIRQHAETALTADRTPSPAKALIGYGLAKHHDRLGDFGAAAHAGRLANAARRRAAGPLDRPALARRVDGIVATYAGDFFADRRRFGVGTDWPVFIVGLPRSGTTLVEQILAAHPLLHGAGELPDLARLAGEYRSSPSDASWRAALHLEERSSLSAAHSYCEAIRRSAPPEALRISDKSPLNFFHLAFAALLFPNARVVHCTRDLRDTALSIWMENFSPDQKWSTDFGDLAFYAMQYRRLMAHWRDALLLPILDVTYEDTVGDLEGQARRLIDFLGVPWDNCCLDFHSSGRAVQTPSRWQVRQPIYSRSVGRWKRYVDHLPELEQAFSGLAE